MAKQTKRTWYYSRQWLAVHFPETLGFFEWLDDELAREMATSYVRNVKRTEARERWLERMAAKRDNRLGPFAYDPEWSEPPLLNAGQGLVGERLTSPWSSVSGERSGRTDKRLPLPGRW